jgi:DNA (cytosine-5)-methyltransferase 1
LLRLLLLKPMNLINFATLGHHRGAPRVWIEGGRLASLGFTPGTSIECVRRDRGVTLAPSLLGDLSVSYRRAGGGTRPIVDVNSARWLGHLAEFDEVKIRASVGRIDIDPSVRGFHIARSREAGPLSVVDVFAGGGTLSDALDVDPRFVVRAAVELDPTFADEFAAKHPAADVFTGDIRRITPEELPACDVLIAGIPCTEHSAQGRAKKGAGPAELEPLGDLYVPTLSIVAAKLPRACVFENVPNFGSSLAGLTMIANLRRLGYHVAAQVVRPLQEWNEPTPRDRWVCVATLRPGFALNVPGVAFAGRVRDYLDQPNAEQDRADAERIAGSIPGLMAHAARHKAAGKGSGFPLLVFNGSEQSAPVICKSYHKINSSGFMIGTPYGPRMLRQAEIERLHGARITSTHYASAVQMLGQGVSSRLFREIFRQLAAFLA